MNGLISVTYHDGVMTASKIKKLIVNINKLDKMILHLFLHNSTYQCFGISRLVSKRALSAQEVLNSPLRLSKAQKYRYIRNLLNKNLIKKKYNKKIISAITVETKEDIIKYKKDENCSDIILFDTPGMETSLKFPENLIKKIPVGEKYALAGSISENNVENICKLGVNFFDLSSSLESQ